jgi:DNA repair exonuclease SbcCD ATPase subunit
MKKAARNKPASAGSPGQAVPEQADPPPPELHLRSFGKFQDRRFALGTTTVFYGPNEAGKTTVFDALFAALCQPRANRTDGKRLRERYGEEAQAHFQDHDGLLPPLISDEEFMNLYAVRAGDIRVEITARSNWMDRVKSRLFSGDLDPGLIARNLEVLASDDGKRLHNKEIKKLHEDLRRCVGELERKRTEQDRIRQREKQIDRIDADLEKSARRGVELRTAIEGLEDALKLEEQIRERDLWNRRLKMSLDAARARERLAAVERMYARDELPELDALETTARNQSDHMLGVASTLEHLTAELERARTDLQEVEASLPLARRRAETADHFVDRIKQLAGNTYWKTVIVWRPAWPWFLGGGALGGLLVGATIAGLARPEADPGLMLLAGLGAAVPGLLLGLLGARKTERVPDETPRQGLLTGLRDDWRSRLKEDFPPASTLDGASQELLRFRLHYEEHEQRLDRATTRCRELQERLDSALAEQSAAAARHSQALQEIENWLRARSVRDRADYIVKRAEYSRASEEARNLSAELQQLLAVTEYEDGESLQIECERRLRALDEAGIPAVSTAGKGRGEAHFRDLQNRLALARQELEQLGRNERELSEKRAGDSGELRGALHRLTEELGTLEQSRLRLTRDIADRELDKAAATAALGIFQEMRSDNNLLLQELLGELGASVRKILPDVAEVGLQEASDFAMQELRIQDAGGTERRIEHLSSGTRDSFVFAARIALAGHSRAPDDPAVLVLDEPFLTLDEPRELQCLEFLREFQERRGWRIVLLTKETRLRNAATTVFPEAVIHELERAGS